MVRLKRGELQGVALGVFIPRRGRGGRRWADGFTVAVEQARSARVIPDDWPRALRGLLPLGVQVVVTVAPTRDSERAGYDLAEALAKRLGRPVVCSRRRPDRGGVDLLGEVAGRRCVVFGATWTSGIEWRVTAQAITQAGGEVLTVLALAATERTEARPAAERAVGDLRAQAKRLRRGDDLDRNTWRQAVFAARGDRCELCGGSGPGAELVPHHCIVAYGAAHLKRAVCNGRIVCAGCHQHVHSAGGKALRQLWAAEVWQAMAGDPV